MAWLGELLFAALLAPLRDRAALVAENLALRQQVAVFKSKHPRPTLTNIDRLFWVVLSQVWPSWRRVLLLVQPETVVRWHKRGYKAYWRWKSRPRSVGRPRIDPEVQRLVRRMAFENPGWGSPRIHGELVKLGINVSERSVARYMPKRPTLPAALKRWITFLHNHVDGIAAMGFFVVPTATFQVLYVWFAIRHARRDVVHFAVTKHPHASWVIQQLREAFPFESAPKYLIFDGDAKFRGRVEGAVADFGMKAKRTAPSSPWQNPIAERWVGSCRRELLAGVVVLNEQHLTRLLHDYTSYYRFDRTHLSLRKDAPARRPVQDRPSRTANVVAFPRVRGLHHRYEWADAA